MINFDCPSCGSHYESAQQIILEGGHTDTGALYDPIKRRWVMQGVWAITFVCACGEPIEESELWATLPKGEERNHVTNAACHWTV